MSEKHKTQIEDFRNLKPYYDLVFEIMQALTEQSFKRDIVKTARALRELIINVSPYILNSKERLESIDTELDKVLTKEYYNQGNISNEQKKEVAKNIDNFFKFIQNLRVEISQEMERSGFMPRMDKVRIKEQSQETKGASL